MPDWLLIVIGALTGLAVLIGALELYLAHRDLREQRADKRLLSYDLMATCVRLEAERERAGTMQARHKAKMSQALVDLGAMKEQVDRMRRIIIDDSLLAQSAPALAELRDDMSDFGRFLDESGDDRLGPGFVSMRGRAEG